MKTTITAGGLVINKLGQVLVVSQNGDSWSLPKGHVDPGEDLAMTARREIKEESGVKDLELIKKLGSYNRLRINDPTEMKEIHLFLFKTEQMELNPEDPDNPEAKWVEKKEVADWLTAKEDKLFFEKIKNEI